MFYQKYHVLFISTAGAVILGLYKMKNKFSASAFTAATTILTTPFILLSTALLSTQITFADSVKIGDTGGLEISITANRRAQATNEALSAVTIITKQDIKNYQATRLEDVLRLVPGISIKNDGGAGKLTSVFMRGTNSSHVLVLIDGIKVGSATAGTTAFEHLPISQIERIEIVRGPRSSLYGAEAIGGVIHIITQKGSGKTKPELTLAYGTNNTQNITAGLSGGNQSNWFRFNVGKEKTDGINTQDSYTAFPPPNFTAAQVKESDKDGYDRNSFSFNVGHIFKNGTTVEMSALDSTGSTEFDGGFQNESDFHERAVSAKVSSRINNKLKLRANIGSSLDDLDSLKDGTLASTFNTKRNTVSLLADITLNTNNNLTIGTDLQKDKVSGTTAYTVDSRKNTAGFISYQGLVANHTVEASVRNDDNEQFGSHTTGGVAVGHNFANGMRVTTSYGTAFKAPTFNDLYYPSSDFYHGNPDLSPETSKTFEVGLSKQNAKMNWGVRAFKTDIDDLISYSADPVTFVGTVKNTDKVTIKGLELELGTKLANWSLNSNFTLLDPKNDSGLNKGKNLIYRPKQIASVDLGRQLGKFNIGATVHAESERYTDAANTDSLGGYATLDLRTDYIIAKGWTIGAKIGNVLDKDYQTNKGYNQDGVNGLLTISYSPK